MQGFLIYKEQIRKIREEKKRGTRTDEEKLPHDNWRLVARRRRLIADRRILTCIILSGLILVGVGIALTLIGFLRLTGKLYFCSKLRIILSLPFIYKPFSSSRLKRKYCHRTIRSVSPYY